MPSPFYGNVDVVGAYEQAKARNQAGTMGQIQQVGALAQLDAQMRQARMQETEMSRQEALHAAIQKLPPEQRTRENVLPLIMQYGSVKELTPLLTNELTANTQKQVAMARLYQAKAISDRDYDIKLRGAVSQEERNRIMAEKANADMQFDTEKTFWETGRMVQPAPLQVPQVNRQPTLTPQPQVVPQGPQAVPAPAAPAVAPPGPVAAPAVAPAVAPARPPAAAPSGMSPKDVSSGARQTKVDVSQDVSKGLRENYDKLRDVPAALNNMEAAKALIPKARVFQGPLGEQKLWAVKFFKDTLGIQGFSVEGIENSEELRSRIFFNVMENLKKLDAQPSQQQQMVMQQSLGNLGTDPDALAKMLDAYAGVLRNRVDLYHKQVDEAKAVGINWPHRINVPQKKQTYKEGDIAEGPGGRLIFQGGAWRPATSQ